MINPIRPEEIIKHRKIPDQVIESFNEIIIKSFDGKTAKVYQNDVVKLIMSKMAISRQDVFGEHYLDIEQKFMEFGWYVEYKQSSYDESWEPYFKFTVLNNNDRD